jgi:Flp pilus assembly protein TadD
MMCRVASSRVRLLTSAATAVLMASVLAGCKTTGTVDRNASLASSNVSMRTEADWRREGDAYEVRFRANPKDSENAIRYAQALRQTGRRAQAAAVLETAAIHNPNNPGLLGAYGRALADAGNFKQALDVLQRAHTPDAPDWRVLSVQGAVLDQMGRHEEAQRHYASALRIVPDEPSVLSNLGLSYALSKDLKRAEDTLRRASARGTPDKRVRQNLALVVGLQGRIQEAEQLAQADLSPEQAAENVAFLRRATAQQKSEQNGRSAAAPLKRTMRARAVEGLDPVDEGGS